MGNVDAARDLTQDVFVTLWNERRRYRDHGKLRAYPGAIARNRCLAPLKRPAKLAPLDGDPRRDPHVLEDRTRAAQLRRSIDNLEPPFAELRDLTSEQGASIDVGVQVLARLGAERRGELP